MEASRRRKHIFLIRRHCVLMLSNEMSPAQPRIVNFQLFQWKFLIFSCYNLIFSCHQRGGKRTNRYPWNKLPENTINFNSCHKLPLAAMGCFRFSKVAVRSKFKKWAGVKIIIFSRLFLVSLATTVRLCAGDGGIKKKLRVQDNFSPKHSTHCWPYDLMLKFQ